MPSVETTKKIKRMVAGSVLKSVHAWLSAFGINALRFVFAFRGLPLFVKEYWILKQQNKRKGSPFRIRLTMPCLDDRYASSGTAQGHYYHQDLLVARRIFRSNPRRHVDVASRVDGFVAHVASFRTIEVFDIRPLGSADPSIIFRQVDLTSPETGFQDYCDSLSCLHALEHFGLGRYGDPIDLHGHEKGFDNLLKILRPGGTLYLSVPIGSERIDFNAHRVLAIQTILSMAHGKARLIGFSYVDDAGDLHEEVPLTSEAVSSNCGCEYGCGIFEFSKTSSTKGRRVKRMSGISATKKKNAARSRHRRY